eukprot:Pgem_evm1s2447
MLDILPSQEKGVFTDVKKKSHTLPVVVAITYNDTKRNVENNNDDEEITLSEILSCETTRKASEENLLFWESVEKYRERAISKHKALCNNSNKSKKNDSLKEKTCASLTSEMKAIFDQYLSKEGDYEINLAQSVLNDILLHIHGEAMACFMFEPQSATSLVSTPLSKTPSKAALHCNSANNLGLADGNHNNNNNNNNNNSKPNTRQSLTATSGSNFGFNNTKTDECEIRPRSRKSSLIDLRYLSHNSKKSNMLIQVSDSEEEIQHEDVYNKAIAYDEAQKRIVSLMAKDSFRRFKSSEYWECCTE